MKKSLFSFDLVVLLFLFFAGYNNTGLQPTASRQTQADSEWTIIQQIKGNLYGNAKPEQVSLAQKKAQYANDICWLVEVNSKKVLELDSDQGLYSYASISLEDLDNDHYEELLVYRVNTGSGGATGLNIYKVRKNGLIKMLAVDPGADDNSDFAVNYLGNYQVRFQYPGKHIDTIIKLKAENYQGMVDELPTITTWVDPIANYDIKDLDNDGIKEVTGIRRVIGISHPDTIATLKLTYKDFDGIYDPTPILYTLIDANGKEILFRKR